MAICWLNGKIVDEANATVSVFDHGLLYGDGVFEGIRFYHQRAFQLYSHLQRLQNSATAIGLTLPYSLQKFEIAIKDIIDAFPSSNGYLRLVITRGKGTLGINPTSCKQATAFIIADNVNIVSSQVQQRGASLIIASTRRLPPDGLDPRIKSLNYLNHILAKLEANHANVDEAILLNSHGNVSEGTADNIFIVRNKTLLTPPVTDGALNGITRDVILKLASESDIKCFETTLSPYDLYTADECFLTGTAIELIAAREIDGRRLATCPGPIFQQLQTAFKIYIGS